MIVYLTTPSNTYTLSEFLEDNAAAFGGRVRIKPYSALFKAREAPVATYIFSDLERLSLVGLLQAARVWRQLAAGDPRIRLVNDPLRACRRYELLRRLHEAGINSFNVYRAADAFPDCRYPVFLRREDDHGGPVSTLIETPAALRAEIDGLAGRGLLRDNHIVVEYCAAPDDTGSFVKYGCFRVGDRIMPQNRLVARQWCVKKFEFFDDEVVRRDLAYVRSGAHDEAVRRVFDIAQVEYGRVDYAIVDGRLEFYELNTNPHNSYRGMDAIPESREYFTPRYVAAMRAIDCPADPAERVPLDPDRPAQPPPIGTPGTQT